MGLLRLDDYELSVTAKTMDSEGRSSIEWLPGQILFGAAAYDSTLKGASQKSDLLKPISTKPEDKETFERRP